MKGVTFVIVFSFHISLSMGLMRLASELFSAESGIRETAFPIHSNCSFDCNPLGEKMVTADFTIPMPEEKTCPELLYPDDDLNLFSNQRIHPLDVPINLVCTYCVDKLKKVIYLKKSCYADTVDRTQAYKEWRTFHYYESGIVCNDCDEYEYEYVKNTEL